MPAISVLMPVYNSMAYLREAIESILNQSFSDFEFLIFNDGSTDGSTAILHSYHDARIRVFDFEHHRGYSTLLNIGIVESRGKYIARMDSDDVAHPDRLSKQHEFLEQHPDHVICGSRYSILNTKEVTLLPLNNDEIKLKLLYITPFCHPSVIIRREVLLANQIFYNPDHAPAEDHELWVRLADCGKFCNLPEVLLHYRIHDNNISFKRRTEEQKQNLTNAQLNYIQKFFSRAQIGYSEATLLHKLFYQQSNFDYRTLEEMGTLLQHIVDSKCTFPVPSDQVHDLLAAKYFYCCTLSTNLGIKAFRVFNHYAFANASIIDNGKLLIKSTLKYKRGR